MIAQIWQKALSQEPSCKRFLYSFYPWLFSFKEKRFSDMKDDFSLFPSNSCHCLCPFNCITEQFFANRTVKITDIKLYKGVVLFVLNLIEPLYNTDVVFELQVSCNISHSHHNLLKNLLWHFSKFLFTRIQQSRWFYIFEVFFVIFVCEKCLPFRCSKDSVRYS